MKLSDNFYLAEFTNSSTATRLNIDNTAPFAVIENLKKLASELENVRTLLGNAPITISSGYRCLDLNTVLRSKPTSSHVSGLACDFRANSFGNPDDIVRAIVDSDINFDQVILEFFNPNTESGWVHFSIPKVGNEPRKQALIIDKQGTSLYTK